MPAKHELNSFLGELGTNIVIYELLQHDWNVFRNMGGQGYDLRVTRDDNLTDRLIEVKTTDPALKTGTAKNQLTAILSPAEYKTSTHCIFYVHGRSAFYIIPKISYPTSRSITLHLAKDGSLPKRGKYAPFKDKWEELYKSA
jgi:hypothetical protein